MRTSFKRVAGAVLVLVVCLNLAGCSGDAEYAQDVQRDFTGNCVGAGNSTTECGCFLERLQKNFSEDEFVAFSSAMNDPSWVPEGDDAEIINEISSECIN